MSGMTTYRVTGVTEDTSYNTSNTVIYGKRVSFDTSSGYSGSVFVPNSVFTDTAATAAMVEGEVRLVLAAQQIAGTVLDPDGTAGAGIVHGCDSPAGVR